LHQAKPSFAIPTDSGIEPEKRRRPQPKYALLSQPDSWPVIVQDLKPGTANYQMAAAQNKHTAEVSVSSGAHERRVVLDYDLTI
jgi:hypothetical protein